MDEHFQLEDSRKITALELALLWAKQSNTFMDATSIIRVAGEFEGFMKDRQ